MTAPTQTPEQRDEVIRLRAHAITPIARLGRALALAGHAAQLAKLTAFRPGNRVALSSSFGMHVGAGIPAVVEAVRLDHGHVARVGLASDGCHAPECYAADRVELALAIVDDAGTVQLRFNALATSCHAVRS